MSESVPAELNDQAEAPAAPTAGSLLRQARQARGLHIAALAASIKVTPQKLELLETDQFDQLPGATFTRALAQTVCRTLKIDAAPVLALLPQPVHQGLEHMSIGLNAPFRDKPGRRVPTDLQFLKSPVVFGAILLVLAAVAVYLLPSEWVQEPLKRIEASTKSSASEPAASAVAEVAASAPEGSSTTVIEHIQAMPAMVATAPEVAASAIAAPTPAPVAAVAASAPVATAATAATAAAPVSGALQVRATEESWIEIVDARDVTLVARMLQPGEAVGFNGALPLRVRIGNASATTVTFKGKAVALKPTRDNVAKLELK
jgi:cytoskeleton protein RodZ